MNGNAVLHLPIFLFMNTIFIDFFIFSLCFLVFSQTSKRKRYLNTLVRSKFEFEQDLPSLYRPAKLQRVLTRSYGTVRQPNQTNIRQGSIFLAKSRRRANNDNYHGAFRLFTVPCLILGLFDRPHWLSPPCKLLVQGTPSTPQYSLVFLVLPSIPSTPQYSYYSQFPSIPSIPSTPSIPSITLLSKLHS